MREAQQNQTDQTLALFRTAADKLARGGVGGNSLASAALALAVEITGYENGPAAAADWLRKAADEIDPANVQGQA
ncbi:MAG: hypothetical protein RIM72_11025 [Alphaproteobacteria bacterium]